MRTSGTIRSMEKPTLKLTFAFVCCIGLLLARSASAQPNLYVAGTAFSDIKQFGSGTIYYPVTGAPTLNTTGIGGGLRVGTFLHPKVSLELGVDVGTTTEATFQYPVNILAMSILPPPNFQLKASTGFVTVDTVLGYHPAARGRMRFGFLGGLSIVRGTYKSDLPGYVLPAATFSETRGAVGPVLITPASIFAPARSYTQKDLTAGGILGFEAAIEFTNRLAVVPEIRSVIFSQPFNGPGVFLIRPGVSVRWGF